MSNYYNPSVHNRRSIRLKGYDYSNPGSYFITICCQDFICRFGHVKNSEMLLNEFGKIAHNEWLKLSDRFTYCEFGVFQIMPNHMHGIITLHRPVGATLAVAPDKPDAHDNTLAVALVNTNAHDNINAVAHSNMNAYPNTNAPSCFDYKNDTNNIHGANTEWKGTDTDMNKMDLGREVGKNVGVDVKRAGMDVKGAGASPAPTTLGDVVGAYKSLVANQCLSIYKSKNEMMGKLWQRNYYERIIRSDESFNRISQYIKNNPANWNEDKFFKG